MLSDAHALKLETRGLTFSAVFQRTSQIVKGPAVSVLAIIAVPIGNDHRLRVSPYDKIRIMCNQNDLALLLLLNEVAHDVAIY